MKISRIKLLLAVMLVAIINGVVLFAAEAEVKTNVIEQLFPDELIDASENKHDTAAALDGKLVGVYFSASTCRGCLAFSRILVPFRDRHSDQFEVVLLGFDKSHAEMLDYMKNYEMKWLAIPWDHPARLAVKEHFAVSIIPTMIVLDSRGRVLTTDGHKQLDLMGEEEALKHWLKLAAE